MSDPERRIELTRAGLDAYLAGDLETVTEMMTPDITVVAGPGMPEAGTYHGTEEFLPWTLRWLDAWDDFHMEVESIEPVGDRHVVAAVTQRGRGRGSGIEVEMPTGHVYGWDGDALAYFALYISFDEALGDARSREEVAAGE